MQAKAIPRAIAGATAIVAAALILLARGPNDPPAVIRSIESDAPAPTEAPIQLAVADAPALPHEALAAAKVRELEAMSETFRNTTFLIAIRDAGYVCNELLRVYGGLDESGKWTATCSEMLAYTVTVAGSGSVRVDPMLQYFDGVRWPIRIDEADPTQIPSDRPLRDSLPPQTR